MDDGTLVGVGLVTMRSLSRKLGPLIDMTSQWCTRRSRIAVARTSSENTWPHSTECLVRGEHDRAAFVAPGDEVEDHVGFFSAEEQGADLVQDQDCWSEVGLAFLGEPAGGLGELELSDKVVELVK